MVSGGNVGLRIFILQYTYKVREYRFSEGTESAVSFFEYLEDAYDFASFLYRKHCSENVENRKQQWIFTIKALQDSFDDNLYIGWIEKYSVPNKELEEMLNYIISLEDIYNGKNPQLLRKLITEKIGSSDSGIKFY